MPSVHVELDRIGPRRWRLVLLRDGWVIDDRELRGGRRKAKRTAHEAINHEQHDRHDEPRSPHRIPRHG